MFVCLQTNIYNCIKWVNPYTHVTGWKQNAFGTFILSVSRAMVYKFHSIINRFLEKSGWGSTILKLYENKCFFPIIMSTLVPSVCTSPSLG